MNSANRTGGAFIRDPETGVVTRDEASEQTINSDPPLRKQSANDEAERKAVPTPKAKKGH
jgi:hypothetical protein